MTPTISLAHYRFLQYVASYLFSELPRFVQIQLNQQKKEYNNQNWFIPMNILPRQLANFESDTKNTLNPKAKKKKHLKQLYITFMIVIHIIIIVLSQSKKFPHFISTCDSKVQPKDTVSLKSASSSIPAILSIPYRTNKSHLKT